MKIINGDAENYLLERVEALRKGRTAWSAVTIHLSRLSVPVQPNMVKAVAHIVGNVDGTEDASLFILRNNDMVLLMPKVDSCTARKVVDEVCFSFAEDEIAQTPVTAGGNDLCRVHVSKEDLVELHRTAIRLQKSHAPTLLEAVEKDTRSDREKFEEARAKRPGRRRLSILVAEDQPFSQQLVLQIIGDKSDVVLAGNGIEAFKLYAEHAPDIAFLDIDMPGSDGLSVLSRITELDEDAFIIMLTASHRRGDVQEALKRKAHGYILKPFTRMKIDQYLHLYRQKHSKGVSHETASK